MKTEIKIPLIKIENISKKFPNGKESLSNINFEIFKNDFILIAGSNGSGKTVLMNIIANLEKSSSGKIINNSKEFNINEHIGIIFQDADSQILGETPEEDILFGLKNLNLRKDETEKKLKEVLSFCELENKKHNPARLMSGG